MCYNILKVFSMIYKNVYYQEEGNNPFFYMSYINPEWFFEDKIIIHPDCKEIMDSVSGSLDDNDVAFI